MRKGAGKMLQAVLMACCRMPLLKCRAGLSKQYLRRGWCSNVFISIILRRLDCWKFDHYGLRTIASLIGLSASKVPVFCGNHTTLDTYGLEFLEGFRLAGE
jgi:hypothetical protein